MTNEQKILLGKNIKFIRTKLGMSATMLAEKAKVAKSSLSDWEHGRTQPSTDALFRICNVLNCDVTELLSADVVGDIKKIDMLNNFIPITKITVPVLGTVACGKPIYAEEHLECYVDTINTVHPDFALWAKGDSMVEARINDGDLVFVKKQEMVENGEIAVVLINDEVTLKKVFYEPNKNRIMLMPANKNYQPFIYEGEELNNIHILGKAVAFQSNL